MENRLKAIATAIPALRRLGYDRGMPSQKEVLCDVAIMMVIAVVVDFLFQSEKSLDKRAYAFFAVAFGYSGAIGLVRWMLARRSPE